MNLAFLDIGSEIPAPILCGFLCLVPTSNFFRFSLLPLLALALIAVYEFQLFAYWHVCFC